MTTCSESPTFDIDVGGNRLGRLREIWNSALGHSHSAEAVAAYRLLLKLEEKVFITDDTFARDLPSICGEARLLDSSGGNASNPFSLKTSCPTFWKHLSTAMKTAIVQSLAPVFASAEVPPFAGSWIQQVTDGLHGLSTADWDRVAAKKADEARRAEAKYRFLVKLVKYSELSLDGDVPQDIVDQMNHIGGHFILVLSRRSGRFILERRPMPVLKSNSLARRRQIPNLSSRKFEIYFQ